MGWASGIVKIGVGIIDYSDAYCFRQRYEYTIVTFDKYNTQSTIPGTYTAKTDAKKRATELKAKISQINGEPCELVKPFKVEGHLDPAMTQELVRRERQFWKNQLIRASKRREDNKY